MKVDSGVDFDLSMPDGDAGVFRRRAEYHLNGGVVPLRLRLDWAPEHLDSVAAVLHAALADPALVAACRAAGIDELDDLHDHMASSGQLDAGALTRTDLAALGERLRWMLTEPEVFYRDRKAPAEPEEAERLSQAFLGWFLGEAPQSWCLAWIDTAALVGFVDNFYDSALVAWRGVELRVLLQNGSD